MTTTTMFLSQSLRNFPKAIKLLNEISEGKTHNMDPEDWMYAYFVANMYKERLSAVSEFSSTEQLDEHDEALETVKYFCKQFAEKLKEREAEIWLQFAMASDTAIKIGSRLKDRKVRAETKRYYLMLKSVADMFEEGCNKPQFNQRLDEAIHSKRHD